jgi:hypothetical protein
MVQNKRLFLLTEDRESTIGVFPLDALNTVIQTLSDTILTVFQMNETIPFRLFSDGGTRVAA